MIHGFKDNNTTTAEEWLIDYSLKMGNSIDINPDLISMSIKFDGKEVDAFILDVLDNRLVIQLVLPLKEQFDGKSNRYGTSYVRELMNSNEFLNRFNQEFVKHIQITDVHTEDYVTNDKFWLLSHEEVVDWNVDFLKPNHECHIFEMFKTIDLKAYSRMLLKEIDAYGWRLRSANWFTNNDGNSRFVGDVGGHDARVGSSHVSNTNYGVLLPACIIC